MKAYKYIVRGSESFPVDLMRRELCWPSTIHDSLSIAIYCAGRNMTHEFQSDLLATIGLTGIKMPSTILWRKSGYYIVKVECVRLSREILAGV